MVEGNKRDSCALIEFLAQLEDEVEFGGVRTWDEISAASRQVTSDCCLGNKAYLHCTLRFLTQLVSNPVGPPSLILNEAFNSTFRLEDLRRAKDLNRGLSFPAISASGSNAAVIHYQPQESTVKDINTEDIYLRDVSTIYF